MNRSHFSKIKNILFFVTFSISTTYGQGIEARWKDHINLKSYLNPFWKTDTITDEIVQIIKDGEIASGPLLFKAKKILSVRSADLSKTFLEGKDWIYENGRIKLTDRSNIPFIKQEDLAFKTMKKDWSMEGKKKGEFVLFNEGTYFRSMQISITYLPDRSKKWLGPLPKFSGQSLRYILQKLNKKEDLKIVFYGNSIETGANSSGFQNQSPFMPSWAELIVYNLRKKYTGKISFSNQSVGGKLAKWGLENVTSAVLPENPDLVIIGFGMNDGTFEVAPEVYREQISGIMKAVLAKNPKAEFILISPMLANPYATQSKIQSLYKPELQKLIKKGVVLADLTGTHQELLKHKTYQDMTGNNVNHPNDYLARWYAQVISAILIKPRD
ncbi:Lysophospholipase L1 [Pedobacter sp. ok626]|uniref:SGNH/GDSL hydrolase family protein n=1 Tax=Pedobacter sp. ok626 TaxID=1761882 RepID=UPI000882B1ED|nr:SGNH/GDSL hydrolase family protein [Pedobacter sp. ok626]SDL35603.1 Lysophospholipase L1 [Pedobacter sp. ok626]